MGKGKQGNHPPRKRRKQWTQPRQQRRDDEEAAAKCQTIEEQLRRQREKAAAARTSSREADTVTTTGPPLVCSEDNVCLPTMKGFVYDEPSQRYFKASDRKKASNMRPGSLPQALNAKNTLSSRPHKSQFCLISSLRSRQLSRHRGSIDFSCLLARSILLTNKGTIPEHVIGIDSHVKYGKLITTASCIWCLRDCVGSEYLRVPVPSASMRFVVARWAPTFSSPLVGAVLVDTSSGVHRVIVVQAEGGNLAEGFDNADRLPVSMLEVKGGISQLQWVVADGGREGGVEPTLALVLCGEEGAYRVEWPSGVVSRLCCVSSPVTSFAALRDCGGCGGVAGLRNGSIIFADSRLPCDSGGGMMSDISRVRSSASAVCSPQSRAAGRMKHCVDHMYAMSSGVGVLVQDVVGNVNLFDIRMSRCPAMTVIRKHRDAAACLVQGSLFWVSSDEKMVLVSGSCDSPGSMLHSRAIDVWSLTELERRHHQEPLPRGGSDAATGSSSRGEQLSVEHSPSNSIRFAPNSSWAQYVPRPAADDCCYSGSCVHGGCNGIDGCALAHDLMAPCHWMGASVVSVVHPSVGEDMESTVLDIKSP
mmetsp:Transcript_12588/g.23330  ORF Transcript_12588/g.23330 Transcript_12588/m.23330 type:complete len:589 (-) Transcript_12588:82-1848(-)|eukprot:CAMPEP_0114429566 /NCGR_PEP_ID=MMETSP0103-20121206/9560_1 /TAXON_ID=37642 ORGANISM="Paraphysomonas imperforata, Strain PA2" /NCGR_SAMPLE_ID=MMETSP0103 /ASSEMBLY_ACC=CAM_ASM_000201 /LENGTH=588 /DNA_ID=CAMNT_0001598923 /DNA_START=85 /DNA_END=1851 /DNA_ORIENTATION=-